MNIILRAKKRWDSWSLPTRISLFIAFLGLLLWLISDCGDRAQNAEIRETHAQVDSIGAGLSDAKRQIIAAVLESTETPIKERLKAQYSLGYALIYVDGENWYFVPRVEK